MMKILTVVFPGEREDVYERQLRALLRSCEANCSLPVEVVRIAKPVKTRERFAFDANHEKLVVWAERVEAAADGDLLVLMDCDMLVLRDFADLLRFEVRAFALCVRSESRYLFNGGFVAVRAVPEARALMRRWVEVDAEFMADRERHAEFRKKYAGINQSSMGALIEGGEAPFLEWLPESLNWCDLKRFDPAKPPHVLHLKGTFRGYMDRAKTPQHAGQEAAWKAFLEYESMPAAGAAEAGPPVVRRDANFRHLISEEYRALNQQLHEERESYGARGCRVLPLVREWVQEYGLASVLDYGCGKGTLRDVWDLPGVALHLWDPCVPEFAVDEPPECDLVVCTDVLEHVEEDRVELALDQVRMLAGRFAYLKISTRLDPDKSLPDGRNPHVSVHDADWWRAYLEKRFERVTEPRKHRHHAFFWCEVVRDEGN